MVPVKNCLCYLIYINLKSFLIELLKNIFLKNFGQCLLFAIYGSIDGYILVNF